MFTDHSLQRILLPISHTFKKKKLSGFTLIELLVVLMIMGILLLAFFAFLNPQKQLDKAKDAVRKHDAQEIKKALDTYYNDHNCYPRSLSFGAQWSENGAVYMKKVPQDPDCNANGTLCYRYEVDTSSTCPQWNVVYVPAIGAITQAQTGGGGTNCGLSLMSNCSPTNGANWSCEISGKPDCNFIANNPLPASTGIGGSGVGVSCNGGGGYVCTPNGCNFGTQGGKVYCSFQQCNQAYVTHQC